MSGMGKVWVWRCPECGKKGETNIAPIAEFEDGSILCLDCGIPYEIEVFVNLWNWIL